MPRRLNPQGIPYTYGRRVFPNGDVYEGDFIKGAREGKGMMRYANGARYEGTWLSNQYEGQGTLFFGDIVEGDHVITGKVYSGQWKGGLMDGRGVLHLGDGGEYEGYFKGGFYSGQGLLKTKDGDVMEGSWSRGRLSGHARVVWADGTRYIGDFLLGEYCGKGKLKFNHGRGHALGDFYYGRLHGVATREYMNGNVYEGSFREGEPDGEGVMHYRSGNVYVGMWKRGKWHGRGVYSTSSGDQYMGQFSEGVIAGEGRYVWRGGGSYEGEYANGLRSGKGTRVWASGAKYEGSWARDKMEGKGVHFGPGGCPKYVGSFAANQKSGSGICTWGEHQRPFVCPLGVKHTGRQTCTFEGNWERDEWKGQGTFRCASGRIYSGTWQGKTLHGWGAAIFMRHDELGNPSRMHTGGEGGLYRAYSFSGQFHKGVRHGFGVLQYANGDRIVTNFNGGHPEGVGVYVFGKGLRMRPARWGRNGRREAWLDWRDYDHDGGVGGGDAESPDSRLLRAIKASVEAKANLLFGGDIVELQQVVKEARPVRAEKMAIGQGGSSQSDVAPITTM